MNKQEIEKAIATVVNLKDRYWESDIYTVLNDTVLPMLYQQLTNGWIPVSERHPIEYSEVFVTTEYNTVHHLYYANEKYRFGSCLGEPSICKVTAWMPFYSPKPYKEVSDDRH